MKRLLVSFAVAAGLAIGMSGTAYAGEVNGNGDDIPAPSHAASECVFSGQDTADTIEDNPEGFDDDGLAVRGNQSPGGKDRYHGVQNYGMFAKRHLKAAVPSPGQACNPS